MRAVSFITTEGSYMNVDISPDGKTLAFDLLGDIYTIPVTGGTAKQLTRGMALHARPIWSPDGNKLAFVSDESGAPNLNIIDRLGKRYQVLGHWHNENTAEQDHEAGQYNEDALWDPEGKAIAYNGHFFSLDGKEISGTPLCQHPLRFSSNGRTLYGIDSGKLNAYNSERSGNLTAINQISQKRARLLRLNNYLYGQIAPDGKYWCYITDIAGNRQLLAENIQTKVVTILVKSLLVIDPRYKDSGIAQLQRFSFAPDSRSVYIGYGGKIHQIIIETGSDKIIPFRATVHVDMGRYNYHQQPASLNNFNVKYCRSASESPDGKHLVFMALDQLYIMDLPKGKPHLLCPQNLNQYHPAWSPDSKWITYASWSDTDGGFVWKVPISGSKPERITAVPGNYQHPVFGPDGMAVLVVKSKDIASHADIGEVHLIGLDPNDDRIISDSVKLLSDQPVFSNDNQTLYFTPVQNKTLPPQLIALNLRNNLRDTIAIGTHSSTSGLGEPPQIAPSPDDKYLVYSIDENLYLVAVNRFQSPALLYKREHNYLAGVRFASGVDPHWENHGKTIAWTYGNKYYKIDPEKVFEATESSVAIQRRQDTVAGAPISVNVTPDRVIDLRVKAESEFGKGSIALKNARILTMHDRAVSTKGTILISNGRIISVGESSMIKIPKGTKTLDLAGKTIMPGLIDLHLHFFKRHDGDYRQQDQDYLSSLAYGVTTARDPSQSFPSFGTSELIRSGKMLGPRFYTVGTAMRFPDGVLHLDKPSDADDLIKKRFLMGGTEIKQYTLPNRIQRQWLIRACEKYGVNMTNEGYYSPLLQLGQIKDGSTGIEHTPVFGDAYNDVIQLRAKAKTYLTATLQEAYGVGGGTEAYFDQKYWHYPDAKWLRFIGNPKMENGRPIMPRTTKDTTNPGFIAASRVDARIRHAGGNVTMGSHGNDKGIGPHNEIWALQMGGLTNMEALQAATINGAKALGIQKGLGSLEVGKIADLIVLDKNPLEDIHNTRTIKYVMKGGILYDGDTLDELWPVKKKCPEWKLKNTNEKADK